MNEAITTKWLIKAFGYAEDIVKKVLKELVEEGLAIKQNGKYSLNLNIDAFRKVAGIFLSPSFDETPGSSYDFNKSCMHFAHSPNVEKFLQTNIDAVLESVRDLGVSLKEDLKDKRPFWLSLEDYRHILQCSPTALRHLLFPHEGLTRRIVKENGEQVMGIDEPLLRYIVLTGLVLDRIRYDYLATAFCQMDYEIVVKGFKHYSRYGTTRKVDYSIDDARCRFKCDYKHGIFISNIRREENSWGI
jgi:hypothetical protein